MKLEDFYSEVSDVLGKPQIIEGIPFHPIKLVDIELTNLLHLLFVKDKAELIDEKRMSFEGVKQSYKASYLKSLLYFYSAQNIEGYYYTLSLLKQFFYNVCRDNENDTIEIAIICNMELLNPLDIFQSPIYIIIQKEDKLLKIDEDNFDVIRECVLRQSGISLKNISGYRADMEALKKQKNQSSKSMSFSDEIFSFISMANMDIYNENFQKYTLYQFKYHFSYLQQYIDYKTLYPLQASGQVKFGSKIKYYLEPLDFNKGRYDDLLITGDDFAQTGIAKSVDGFVPPVNNTH